ncbi:MAG: ABC transporter permease [SAR202 cluster bacterium]|nr:ABC transporter permease [SAR202 cluster bacterium]
MMAAIVNSNQLTLRLLRAFVRQPYYVAITLVQPVIWLFLFGQLFRDVVRIPGFATDSYVSFLTPGVVVMTALFSNGWSGMGSIFDIERGVMNRFLVTPVSRVALMTGRIVSSAVSTLIQALIILALGFIVGARFAGGPAVMAVFLVATLMLGMTFASLSNALALLLRKQESVIAAVNFLVMPLTFMSATFMPANLVPGWIQAVARYNPVNWAVEIGRQTITPEPDWSLVAARFAALAVLLVAAALLATRAFRAYQRSV